MLRMLACLRGIRYVAVVCSIIQEFGASNWWFACKAAAVLRLLMLRARAKCLSAHMVGQ
jgi:hypothetical protein